MRQGLPGGTLIDERRPRGPCGGPLQL